LITSLGLADSIAREEKSYTVIAFGHA